MDPTASSALTTAAMLPIYSSTSLGLCIDGPEGVGALAAHAASAVAALADTPTQTAALAALRSLVEGMAAKPSDVDTARCKAICETCVPWLVAALGRYHGFLWTSLRWSMDWRAFASWRFTGRDPIGWEHWEGSALAPLPMNLPST
jgi:hypothetical protein